MTNLPVFAQAFNQDPNIIRTSYLFYSYPGFGYLPAFVSPFYYTGYFGFPQFGGFSLDYATPIGGFSSGQALTLSPAGSAYHVSGELLLPWTYYGTSIDTSFSAGAVPGPFGFIPTARYGISNGFGGGGSMVANGDSIWTLQTNFPGLYTVEIIFST